MKHRWLLLVVATLMPLGIIAEKGWSEDARSEVVKNEALKNEQEHNGRGYKPDNTGVNVRDRDTQRLTADDQTNNSADLELIARIRKALRADDSLSSYAQNIKVIAQNGVVTLRGPVRSVDERTVIERTAREAAGANTVQNELQVTNKNQS